MNKIMHVLAYTISTVKILILIIEIVYVRPKKISLVYTEAWGNLHRSITYLLATLSVIGFPFLPCSLFKQGVL
jgi:hypothetical protein